MKKIYLFALVTVCFTIAGFAQPGAVGNNNISGAPFVCTSLTAPSGSFFQARILANQNSVAATWEFPQNCSYPGDVWRPYFGSGVTFNSTVVPAPGPGDGALYNSANGGASGTLPATTNGNYYTFNIQNVSAPTNAYMAVLETNYNPVTISAVSNTTPANASNSVLVNCTASSAPVSGEYVYVRYSTDGYVTSALAQFSFTGTAGQALIPCFAGATVVNYYVMSSNRTAAQIAADVLASGTQVSYDMLTLNLNNNGGPNYSYTQGSATNFGGVYSTPSTCYATVSAFVTALNLGTVTAPVTMYAIGGSATETATVGGIDITKTGTAANPIIFQKFGSGTYTIQSSAALVVGRLYDGIIKLTGADYITIDGFNLQENAANVNSTAGTNTMTEWGIALLHTSSTDGAQNNTIQNNTITLNRIYTNTFGIYSNARHNPTTIATANDITNNTTGPNNGNKIYGNTISNVNMGITFIGVSAPANHDVGNDIGGSSAATGNTISNWGGAAAASGYVSNSGTSYCIFLNQQVGDNISYNTITSAAVTPTVTFRGIFKDYTATAPTGTFTSTISNNTVTLSNAATSGNYRGIESAGMGTLSTATINITNNTILNMTMSGASSSSTIFGILNSSAPGVLNLNSNVVRGTTSTATTGGFTGIQNSGAVVTSVNILSNEVGNGSGGAVTYSVNTTSTVVGINNSGGAATATINMNNNTVSGITVLSSAQITCITNTGAANSTVNIGSNTIQNNAITGVGATPTLLGIVNTSAVSALSITNNIIRGNTSTATTGGFTGIQNSGGVVNTTTITGNQIGSSAFDAVTFSAATTVLIAGISNTSAAATTTVNISANSIMGLSGVSTTNTTTGIQNLSAAGVAVNITNNTLGSAGRGLFTYTAPSTGSVYGIFNSGGASTTNLTVTGNTVDRISGVSFSNVVAGIANNTAIGGAMNLNNNAIGTTTGTFLTTTANSTGQFYAMWNSNGALTATLNMNNNTVDGFYIFSTTFNLTTMACNGANLASANMNNNIFGSTGTLINFSGTQPASGTFRVIDIAAGSSNPTCTIMCQNNTVSGIHYAVTGAGTVTCVFINSSPLSATIQNNQFINLSLNTTDNVWGVLDIASRGSGQTLTINNNSIVTGLTKTAGSGYVAGQTSYFGAPVNGAVTNITNNNFSNITVTGNTIVYGVRAETGVSSSNGPTLNITGNTISNITAGSGALHGIYTDIAAAVTCSNNTISNFTGTGDMYGLNYGSNNGQGTFAASTNNISSLVSSGTGGNVRGIYANAFLVPTFNVNSNIISGLSSTGASASVNGILMNSNPAINVYDNQVYNLSGSGTTSPTANGINIAAGTTLNIYRNQVHNIRETGAISATSPAVSGIRVTNGTTVNAYNNFIADLKADNANLADAIRGINFSTATASSSYNVYYNSIYIDAVSAGINFGTSGIYHTTSATATTSALNMINNIIVNTSTPNGTGFTAAYRRSDATLTNFAVTSDYNLFYAGTPSATRLIYYDGTNSDQTIAAYQTRVSTRDANSISLMPTFVSATDLHLTSANCRIDGRGTPIGIVTDDIDLDVRNATTPDIGGDEFTATTSTTLAGSAGGTVCEDRTISVTGTTYTSNVCDLIARVLPSGADPVSGKVNVCVTLDATQQTFNGEPYVQRHFDMEPTTSNQTTTSATITLYFTDV